MIVMHLLFMIGALFHKPKLGSNVECPHDRCQDDYEAAPIIHFQPHPLPHQSSYPTHDINLVQYSQSPAPSWPGYYLRQDHHPSLHLTRGSGVACSDEGGGSSQPWQAQYVLAFLR